jgi:dTDP-glucose pyrophosphorylase
MTNSVNSVNKHRYALERGCWYLAEIDEPVTSINLHGRQTASPDGKRPIRFYVLDNTAQVGISEVGTIISPETGDANSNAYRLEVLGRDIVEGWWLDTGEKGRLFSGQ